MNEHIDEMAKVLVDYTNKNHIIASHVILEDYAEQLYNAGYRKQEWISVDERLPENEQMVLTIDTEGEMQVCFYETEWEGIFHMCHGLVKIYNITHWMPLPEAPKMKRVVTAESAIKAVQEAARELKNTPADDLLGIGSTMQF